jgi:hypothetical protein
MSKRDSFIAGMSKRDSAHVAGMSKRDSRYVEMEDEGEKDNYPTGAALWSALVPIAIGYFLYFLDTCIVATASPAITSRFDSLTDIGWYGGAYQLGNAAVRPLTGKIYSHFSVKAGHPIPIISLPF